MSFMEQEKTQIRRKKANGRNRNIKPENAYVKGGSQARQSKAAKKITETYLHNAGLYYLQRFATSTTRFREVMTRKITLSCRAHPDQNREDCIRMLDRLIDKFIDLGLLNDDGYAQGVASSLHARGLSERAIRMKMQMRGLNEEQIDTALKEYLGRNETSRDDLEMKAALKLAKKKKAGPYAQEQDYDYEKTLAAFARAGFSYDLSRRVLDMSLEDIPE